MKKVKFVLSLLAIAAGSTLGGAAQAAQVLDAPCPEQNSGTFGATASNQGVICANGKWQDAATLPMTGMRIRELAPKTKAVDKSFEAVQPLGVKSVRQTSDDRGTFTLVTSVVALNPDKTAHIVMDLSTDGWQKHVDATVPLGTSTAVATGKNGEEYDVEVKRLKS